MLFFEGNRASVGQPSNPLTRAPSWNLGRLTGPRASPQVRISGSWESGGTRVRTGWK